MSGEELPLAVKLMIESFSMSGEDLPLAVKLLIEKEVERRAGELRRAGYVWTDMVCH
jgi:hypothetical protein